jgi:hypothetical protein
MSKPRNFHTVTASCELRGIISDYYTLSVLYTFEYGGGQVRHDAPAGRAALTVPVTPPRRYADAQLDSYHGTVKGLLRRPVLDCRPPLRLSLRARASHPAPLGTLGFGFWNEPFSLTGGVMGAPKVLWFFHASRPSNMALVDGVPGWGWKAATLDAGRWPGLLLAPAALGAILLTRLPGLGRPIMKLARRFVKAHEAMLSDVALHHWHDYEILWLPREARFSVDGVLRLVSPAPPPAPLGLVIWLDNQYAITSAEGKFGFGLLPLPEPQILEIESLTLSGE